MRFRVAQLTISLLFAASGLSGQEPPGSRWLKWTEPERLTFLYGYFDGVSHGLRYALLVEQPLNSGWQFLDSTERARAVGVAMEHPAAKAIANLNLSASQKEAIEDGRRLWMDRHVVSERHDLVSQHITALYRDSGNLRIWPASIVSVAIMKLRNAPAADVQREIELQRRIAPPY